MSPTSVTVVVVVRREFLLYHLSDCCRARSTCLLQSFQRYRPPPLKACLSTRLAFLERHHAPDASLVRCVADNQPRHSNSMGCASSKPEAIESLEPTTDKLGRTADAIEASPPKPVHARPVEPRDLLRPSDSQPRLVCACAQVAVPVVQVAAVAKEEAAVVP